MKSAPLKDAIAFLYSPDNMQQVAFGTMSIRLSNGDVMEVPATMRTKAREQIFMDYAEARRNPRGKTWFGPKHKQGSFRYDGLGRTKFLEAAVLAAKGDLKQLGALDAVSEFCGRMQFEVLRKIVRELAALCPSDCSSFEKPILDRIDAVEVHVKRQLKAHLGHADAAKCAWHCANHAHADASGADKSRPAPCTHVHAQGCMECAQLAALQADLDVLLTAAERCLQRNLPSPAAAASLAVGSFVTYTDEAGLTHSTVVREVHPPEGGAFPPPPIGGGPAGAAAPAMAPGPANFMAHGGSVKKSRCWLSGGSLPNLAARFLMNVSATLTCSG